MTEDTTRRAHDLVEELRADIDFEIDDVIANIVRDLPDDYFERLKRAEQLTHLKTLLALNICQLNSEIMLRSDDERHVAVIARQDYPGLLAKILRHLPTKHKLIEAQIFTSKAHDFIIDLFEFESPDAESREPAVESHEIETLVDSIQQSLGVPREQVVDFVSHYPKSSHVFNSPDVVKEHFLALLELQKTNEAYIGLRPIEGETPELVQLTIATNHLTAREVFQRSAEFLAGKSFEIEEAFLNDLSVSQDENSSVSSFLISSTPGNNEIEGETPVLDAKMVEELAFGLKSVK
ncbi:MAG: hypothetical protein AB8B55_11975 [Mariniblastus sp.]